MQSLLTIFGDWQCLLGVNVPHLASLLTLDYDRGEDGLSFVVDVRSVVTKEDR